MQDNPTYEDVVSEVEHFLVSEGTRLKERGLGQLWLDPGIGFGKTLEHNVALLAATSRLARSARELGAGLLIGTSRKRFLGQLAGPLDVDARLEGSVASEAFALVEGASMVRVHDVGVALQLRDLLTKSVGELVA
jgi:dihydropteroate synthase